MDWSWCAKESSETKSSNWIGPEGENRMIVAFLGGKVRWLPLKVTRQKRLWQCHLASCPRSQRAPQWAEDCRWPWYYSETPSAASLVEFLNRQEYVFIIIKIYFLGTVNSDPHGGVMWKRRSCTYLFFPCSSGLCSFCCFVSALAFYELSWESVHDPELLKNDPCHLPVSSPCSFLSYLPCLSPFPLPYSTHSAPHVGVYRLCGLTREESEEEWDGERKEEVVSHLVLDLWPYIS